MDTPLCRFALALNLSVFVFPNPYPGEGGGVCLVLDTSSLDVGPRERILTATSPSCHSVPVDPSLCRGGGGHDSPFGRLSRHM